MNDMTLSDEAFHQTLAMARSVGVNLPAAVAQGQIASHAAPAMMAACHRCAHSSACTDWLSECRPEPAQAPDFCVHKPVLDRLTRAAR